MEKITLPRRKENGKEKKKEDKNEFQFKKDKKRSKMK